jgi:hypothetical protein
VVITGGLLGGLIALAIRRARPEDRERGALPSLSRA